MSVILNQGKNMKKHKQAISVLVLVFSLSCNFLAPAAPKSSGNTPVIDFTMPAEPLNVKVTLDDSSSTSETISPSGGSLALTAADGSVYKLEIPAKALDADTMITMTGVKSIDGAPLSGGSVSAVQLEPSGLFFNELVTLTIIPEKAIPVKEQIIFGYEGNGQEYHLAVVDPKSKDIRIKLMKFSGAGVGSGSDPAWAANLQIQASNASARLWQKFGEISQRERRSALLGTEGEPDNTVLANNLKSTLDQFEDQVVIKEMAAAELDCKYAGQAMRDLLYLGRLRQVAFSMETPGFNEKLGKLSKIIKDCKKDYLVSGESNNVSFSGKICGLDKPFVIDATFPGGGTAKTTFTPSTAVNGTTTVTGGGAGCVQTGAGKYTVTINEAGNGTLQWTTTDTLTCPNINNTQTGSFTLPLQIAPEGSCGGQ
jgi:hypothetical protein